MKVLFSFCETWSPIKIYHLWRVASMSSFSTGIGCLVVSTQQPLTSLLLKCNIQYEHNIAHNSEDKRKWHTVFNLFFIFFFLNLKSAACSYTHPQKLVQPPVISLDLNANKKFCEKLQRGAKLWTSIQSTIWEKCTAKLIAHLLSGMLSAYLIAGIRSWPVKQSIN